MPYISTNIHPTHCYAYNKYSVTNTHRHVLMFLKCLGVHSCYSFFSPSSFEDLVSWTSLPSTTRWLTNKKGYTARETSGPIQPNCSGLWSFNLQCKDLRLCTSLTDHLQSHTWVSWVAFVCFLSYFQLLHLRHFNIVSFLIFLFSPLLHTPLGDPSKPVWHQHRI